MNNKYLVDEPIINNGATQLLKKLIQSLNFTNGDCKIQEIRYSSVKIRGTLSDYCPKKPLKRHIYGAEIVKFS